MEVYLESGLSSSRSVLLKVTRKQLIVPIVDNDSWSLFMSHIREREARLTSTIQGWTCATDFTSCSKQNSNKQKKNIEGWWRIYSSDSEHRILYPYNLTSVNRHSFSVWRLLWTWHVHFLLMRCWYPTIYFNIRIVNLFPYNFEVSETFSKRKERVSSY